MKNLNLRSILVFVVAALFYIAAIIGLTGSGQKSIIIFFLCMGTFFLCMGLGTKKMIVMNITQNRNNHHFSPTQSQRGAPSRTSFFV